MIGHAGGGLVLEPLDGVAGLQGGAGHVAQAPAGHGQILAILKAEAIICSVE